MSKKYLSLFSLVAVLFAAQPVAATSFLLMATYNGQGDGPGGSPGSSSETFPILGISPGVQVRGVVSYNQTEPLMVDYPGIFQGRYLFLRFPVTTVTVENPWINIAPRSHDSDGAEFQVFANPTASSDPFDLRLAYRTADPGFGPKPPTTFDLNNVFDAFISGHVYDDDGRSQFFHLRLTEVIALPDAEADRWIAGHTPLPPALPLFVSGIGAIAFLAWRRKRPVG